MSELSNKIDQVRDILRTDDGISGAMDYTEAISWVLFLKFLDDYENSLNDEAFLENRTYNYVIDKEHRWSSWACPKDENGNVFKGEGVALDSTDNLTFSESGHCITLLGVKDLIVVQSGDATMVCHKDKAQEVKALAQAVGSQNPSLT